VTYTQAALMALLAAVVVDVMLLRTRLLGRRVFWVSYAIVLVFQLLTNGLLTASGTVRYSDAAIYGSASPIEGPPPMIGDGRVIYAPIEDLVYGFALILLTMSCWIWLGRQGVQREPVSGPPRLRRL